MNFLQYKSDEMFSSTHLIRKSKMIFDKLSKDEIEKAVILRDGKPSFMLLDFEKYEKIMEEYMQLKSAQQEEPVTIKQESIKVEQPLENKSIDSTPEAISQEVKSQNIPTQAVANQINEIKSNMAKAEISLTEKEQEELDKALQDLENLDMKAVEKDNKSQELKEFWD